MKKEVAIIGCGWLGLPLAKSLVKDGWKVKGSTTTKEKKEVLYQANIQPFHFEVSDKNIEGDEGYTKLFEAEYLIINIPPRRRKDIETYHYDQLRLIVEEIKKGKTKHLLFVSSTSVYTNNNDEVDEENTELPDKPSGKVLRKIEKMILDLPIATTVIRLAGLIGYDRLPGRFLAGKKELKNGDVPINVIHQDDCIGLIRKVVEKSSWNEIYNGCATQHPLRKDYYTKAALQIGLEPPQFVLSDQVAYKIVSNTKSQRKLDYTYKYPDPMELLDFDDV